MDVNFISTKFILHTVIRNQVNEYQNGDFISRVLNSQLSTWRLDCWILSGLGNQTLKEKKPLCIMDDDQSDWMMSPTEPSLSLSVSELSLILSLPLSRPHRLCTNAGIHRHDPQAGFQVVKLRWWLSTGMVTRRQWRMSGWLTVAGHTKNSFVNPHPRLGPVWDQQSPASFHRW